MIDQEAFEERAAIMEFDGGLPRDVAEALAIADVVKQEMIGESNDNGIARSRTAGANSPASA